MIVVAFLRRDKLDLGVGRPGGHAAVPDFVSVQEGKGLPERLLETGAHEAVNNGIDGGVGIRHAVCPCLDLIRGIRCPKIRIEGLKEDKDLDGTPAQGK